MIRRNRMRALPQALETLESRWLLAAPQIPGNLGEILFSQFQPNGFKTTVGTQLQDVKLRGPFSIDVVTAAPSDDMNRVAATPPINSGLIEGSQFNAGGFLTIGLQLDRIYLGGGLTVHGYDDEGSGAGAVDASGLSIAAETPSNATLPALVNRGLISNSQFSDGGFGTVIFNPDGTVLVREGRVGFQWLDARVRGSVDIGIDDQIIQPGAVVLNPEASNSAAIVASAAPGLSYPGKTVIDKTKNIGRIRRSQVNDGGFGDIGLQWSDVAVGGGVGTSTNTLFIKPQLDNNGPITVADRVFGRRAKVAALKTDATTAVSKPVAQSSDLSASATAAESPYLTTYTNSATNSGQIIGAQFNDGGFGDVGLQWKKVRVGGSVTAVHNSLTVQPENKGQGLITVRGVTFPTVPEVGTKPVRAKFRTLPANPAVVESDGAPLTTTLPKPTGPLSPFFPTPFDGAGTVTLPYPGNYPLVNSASNSGLIAGGQFSSGGFGDLGMQWQHVGVSGNVRVVHNSLSVHPEGSQLEGISVSDVSYGPAISRRVARHLAVLPYAVISPGSVTTESRAPVPGAKVLNPPNSRWLTDQQLAAASGTDIFLQWNGIEHRRGLVVVHNIIKITGVGVDTGPITLKNIRFPYLVPPLGPLKAAALQPIVTVGDDPRDATLLNSADNSGILSHAQFSDGGFGDDGLQWRNVSVDGSVEVVHNTLAVDASSDLPDGDVAGPITISNVTFNSGALEGNLSRQQNQLIVSPPDVFQRVSSRHVNLGRALPQNRSVRNEATNSGIMAGGQLSAGGANHTFLQWQCVKVHGKVRVIDNILSISVQDRPSGPITISDVTFA
ncbi:hypothetical protein EP7_001788 [Isosphaeraceae bacterium EP7]